MQIIFIDGNSGVGKTTLCEELSLSDNNYYVHPYLEFSKFASIPFPENFDRYTYKQCLERINWWLEVEEARMKFLKNLRDKNKIFVDTSLLMVIGSEVVSNIIGLNNASELLIYEYKNLLNVFEYNSSLILILNSSIENINKNRRKRGHVDSFFVDNRFNYLLNSLFNMLSNKNVSNQLKGIIADDFPIKEVVLQASNDIDAMYSSSYLVNPFLDGIRIIEEFATEFKK